MTMPALPSDLHHYVGAIHLHSAHSHDGRRTVKEIAQAAARCGLDFVMLTDHFSLAARQMGEDGWRGRVLVVVGEEVSPRYNHLLVFGLDEPLKPAEGETPQGLIDRAREQGGVCFLAHPDHKGTELFGVPSCGWRDWDVTGFAGLGIWDVMTDWQRRLTSYPRALLAYLSPALALRGPELETLARWDELGRGRRVAGLGELDNHDFHRHLFGFDFSIFPFQTAFRLVLTHVLLTRPFSGERAADEAALLEALCAGRAYVCLEALASGRGFEFFALMEEIALHMGDEVPLCGQAEFVVRLPRSAHIRLLRDGRPEVAVYGRELHHVARRPGVWRVECRLSRGGIWRPWLYANPIYLREPAPTPAP
jgi:hypothetical protein